MGYRGVALAIGLSVASAGLAAGCAWRAQRLASQASWLMARGVAEGAEYTSTFDGQHIDRELVTFQQRRELLEAAHRWQRGSIAGVMAAALALAASYLAWLLVRLEQQRLNPDDGAHTALQVR
ncbi:MAG TPA: hypothetical protein VFA20_25520 [Myxococcaceae bacterium]|nr:hypothetical protein [Myxococcaceae bacterium]